MGLMSDENIRFGESRIMNSQVDTLIGLTKGLLADGELNESEIHALQNWLNVNLYMSI